jgi:hypothetical protein
MSRLWVVRESIPDFVALEPQTAECALVSQIFCRIHNGPELMRSGRHGFRNQIGELPTVQVQFKLDDFDWDYFTWHGLMFVSEYMRKVMALDPSEARFYDIDDSLSPPAPREMKYQIMEPLRDLPIADRAALEAEWAKNKESAIADPTSIPSGPTGLALLQDVTPAHELFYDDHYRRLFCTDAFALRLLQAGCVGMAFADPTHLYGEQCRFRTLQGVEEYVSWDEPNLQLIMKLVEAIP